MKPKIYISQEVLDMIDNICPFLDCPAVTCKPTDTANYICDCPKNLKD